MCNYKCEDGHVKQINDEFKNYNITKKYCFGSRYRKLFELMFTVDEKKEHNLTRNDNC